MTENQVRLTIGALLHDVGKVIYRTGDGRNHSASGRQIERAVRGSKFPLDIIYEVKDEETLKSDMQLLKEGFQMLQYDYIGGNGSRGYGKVKFYDLEAVVVIGKVSEETMEECNRILSEV